MWRVACCDVLRCFGACGRAPLYHTISHTLSELRDLTLTLHRARRVSVSLSPGLRLFVRPSHAPSGAVIAGADEAASGGRETKFGQRCEGYLIRVCPAKRELDRVLVVLYQTDKAAMAGGESASTMNAVHTQTRRPRVSSSPSPTVCAVPSAMVSFPASDSSPTSAAHPPEATALPASHLPFRRISLPSVPNLQNRLSVVSTASFDSVPEVAEPLLGAISSSPSKAAARSTRPHAASMDAFRRNQRRREVKSMVVDEQREAKRRKVIHELHETERTYLEGLELIYSVRTVMSLIRAHSAHLCASIS